MNSSIFSFDHSHSEFDKLLKKYVSKGLVNYSGLMNEKTSLLNYNKSLEEVSKSEYDAFSREEKLAFLINAYNSFTLQLILDHYPISSIGEIGGLFKKVNLMRGTPWKKEFFTLVGEKRNLDWIEHEKLRKDFGEPRIHFAIVCASIGCPPLRAEAYVPKNINSQLESNKKVFLSDASKNSYDASKNKLSISPIFKWFEKDFTKKGTVQEFLENEFPAKVLKEAKIEYTDYDWNLNVQK